MTLLSNFKLMFILVNPFVDRFKEGGPFFMSLILICLLLSIFFIVKSSRNLNKSHDQFLKYISLTAETGLLALVLGILGSVIGLIETFDAIEGFNEEIHAAMIAGGLKVTFLSMVFGTFTFIVARIAIIILKWRHTPSVSA